MQSSDHTYFDREDALVIDSNPGVKAAWDQSLKMVDAGLSAKLKSFSPEWNAGFKNGSFATLACPAWMTGYIKDQAGAENSGKWDITTVPGGGGNWGGSWLGVPTQSKHQKEAIELAKFLTTGESQLAAFKAAGNLPSNPKLYEDAALKGAKNDYFNNAPGGRALRRRRGQPQAGLPRCEEPAGARRGRERDAQRRGRPAQRRRRLEGSGLRGPEGSEVARRTRTAVGCRHSRGPAPDRCTTVHSTAPSTPTERRP